MAQMLSHHERHVLFVPCGGFVKIASKLELLEQSFLSKAFQGELGTNDQSEENANEILKELLQNKLNNCKKASI